MQVEELANRGAVLGARVLRGGEPPAHAEPQGSETDGWLFSTRQSNPGRSACRKQRCLQSFARAWRNTDIRTVVLEAAFLGSASFGSGILARVRHLPQRPPGLLPDAAGGTGRDGAQIGLRAAAGFKIKMQMAHHVTSILAWIRS